MGVQTLYGKGPRQLLWAGSRAARWRIHDGPNYCVIFIVYTYLANVAVDRIIKPGGPWFADTCLKGFRLWYVVIVESEILDTILCSGIDTVSS